MSKIEELKIGTKDLNGYLITKIFARGDEYLIYEIKTDVLSESFRVIINPESKAEFNRLEENFESIKPKVNEIKAILYKANRENSLKQLLASSVSLGITQNDHAPASQMLDDLKTRINEEYKSMFINKSIYSLTGIAIVVLGFIFSYLTYSIYRFSCLMDYPILQVFIYSGTAGILGGFLSLSFRLTKINIEKEVKWFLFVFYSGERMFISLINSIAIVAIIKSGQFLNVINESKNSLWCFISLSILAGFSETFIPDILTKMEKENK